MDQALLYIKMNDKKGLDNYLTELERANFLKIPLVEDDVYDIIERLYKSNFGDRQQRKELYLQYGKEVELPRYLGSLSKHIKGGDSYSKLVAFFEKYTDGNILLSGKADGMTVLIQIIEGQIQLFTRGDGKRGRNISHFAPYLFTEQFLDFIRNTKPTFDLRGEIIAETHVWEKHMNSFSSERHMVSGLISRDTAPNKGLLSVVLHEFLPAKNGWSASKQNTFFEKLPGIKGVPCKKIESIPTEDQLSKELEVMKKTCTYPLDGLVMRSSNRIFKPNTSGNPKWAKAYKDNLNLATSTVREVVYAPSEKGAMKPTIYYNPFHFPGIKDTYRKTTGHNAAFIRDNGIGPGAIVLVVLSGDVIANVMQVLTKASPQLPSDGEWGDGENGRSKRDMFVSKDRPECIQRGLKSFFSRAQGLDIKGFGDKTVELLYSKGYKTVNDILTMTKEDYLQIYPEKTSQNKLDAIHTRLQRGVKLSELIGALPCFSGIRKTTAASIILENRKLFEVRLEDVSLEKLMTPKGTSEDATQKLKEGYSSLLDLLHSNTELYNSIIVDSKNIGKSNRIILITGTLEGMTKDDAKNMIEAKGDTCLTSWRKDVTHLVVGCKDWNSGKKSSKYEKALKNGLSISDNTIMGKEQFLTLYK